MSIEEHRAKNLARSRFNNFGNKTQMPLIFFRYRAMFFTCLNIESRKSKIWPDSLTFWPFFHEKDTNLKTKFHKNLLYKWKRKKPCNFWKQHFLVAGNLVERVSSNSIFRLKMNSCEYLYYYFFWINTSIIVKCVCPQIRHYVLKL